MNRTDDARAVAAVVDRYGQATKARDVDALKGIFHADAVMSGYLGPDLLVGSPEPFYDHLASNEIAPDYAHQVTGVQVTGHTAAATVVEDNLFGMSFVNQFHLVREPDGRWIITSKLFHHDAP